MEIDLDQRLEVYGIRPGGRRSYYRQHYALDETSAHEQSKGLRMPVFAVDNPRSKTQAAKKYYCMSVAELVDWLLNHDPSQWCFFEVTIPDRPTKIYLDVEAALDLNPGFDHEKMRKMIIKEYTKWLADNVCPRFGDSKHFQWTIFDASSSAKWSLHFIGQGEAMAGVYHVGATVRRFKEYITDKYGHRSEWFVKSKRKGCDGPVQTFVIDDGVYTMHRVYRMVYQHKYGSSRTLFPFGTKDKRVPKLNVEEMYHSMVQAPFFELACGDGHTAHTCKEHDGSEPYSIGAGGVVGVRRTHLKASGTTRTLSNHGATCPVQIYSLFSRVLTTERCVEAQPQSCAMYYPGNMTVVMRATTSYCHIKGGAHHADDEGRGMKRSCTYYCFRILSKDYMQKCFAATCVSKMKSRFQRDKVTWPLPPSAVKELAEIMDTDSEMGDGREAGYVYVDDIAKMLEAAKVADDEMKGVEEEDGGSPVDPSLERPFAIFGTN